MKAKGVDIAVPKELVSIYLSQRTTVKLTMKIESARMWKGPIFSDSGVRTPSFTLLSVLFLINSNYLGSERLRMSRDNTVWNDSELELIRLEAYERKYFVIENADKGSGNWSRNVTFVIAVIISFYYDDSWNELFCCFEIFEKLLYLFLW